LHAGPLQISRIHWSWPVQPSNDRALELLPDSSIRHKRRMRWRVKAGSG
jgi:hypothetical protein